MDNVNTRTVIVSPNGTNIRLVLNYVSDDTLECLDWVVWEVEDKGLSMTHILVYVRSVKNLSRVFECIYGELDALTHAGDKNHILSSLCGQGSCRVVVATIALWVGLNFPNVSHVIIYGAPEDVEGIVQQAGCAGRGGSQ